MTLLASQIPLLYCLLYFQSNRRPAPNQSTNNRLLNALTSQGRSSTSLRRSRTFTTRRDDSSQELFAHEKHLAVTDHGSFSRLLPSDLELEERSWVRHQDTDPRQLCLERYYFHSSQTSRSKNHFLTNEDCSRKHQDNVREMMSERFMTLEQLQTLLPEMTKFHNKEDRPTTRYKAESLPYANLKSSIDNQCEACNTEIGYEVMTHIQDFQGTNYTVINFENAYQFIPAGRCINENSPCGGGGNARCVQIYRAQWTLVWAASSGGTRLLAHEVPSHCQCINVGSPVHDSVKNSSVKNLGEGIGAADNGRTHGPPQ